MIQRTVAGIRITVIIRITIARSRKELSPPPIYHPKPLTQQVADQGLNAEDAKLRSHAEGHSRRQHVLELVL